MYTSERRIATSVLVIGTGGSGLRAVIELVERRVGVLAVGKRPKTDAHTSLAAGGINAALATIEPEDTWQQHAADMLKESYLLANPHTARIVTESAARGTADLEGYGVPFAREEDGHVSQRFFGAHTYRRAAFAGGYSGLETQRTLVDRAAGLDITVLDTVYVTKLLVHDDAPTASTSGTAPAVSSTPTACTRSARRRAACTGRTGSAATRSSNSSSSAASSARRRRSTPQGSAPSAVRPNRLTPRGRRWTGFLRPTARRTCAHCSAPSATR